MNYAHTGADAATRRTRGANIPDGRVYCERCQSWLPSIATFLAHAPHAREAPTSTTSPSEDRVGVTRASLRRLRDLLIRIRAGAIESGPEFDLHRELGQAVTIAEAICRMPGGMR